MIREYNHGRNARPRAADGAGQILSGGLPVYAGMIAEWHEEREECPIAQPPGESTGNPVDVEIVTDNWKDVCYIVHDKWQPMANPFVWQMLYKRGGNSMRAYPLLAKKWGVHAVIGDQAWMAGVTERPQGKVEILK